MATKTITQFTAATSLSTGDEMLIETGGNTRKITAADAGLMVNDGATFTPTLGATTADGTHTYATQIGRYWQLGDRLIFFTINVDITNIDASGTITGDLRIKGLPVTARAGIGNFPCTVSTFNHINLGTNYYTVAASVVGGTTQIELVETGDDLEVAVLTEADLDKATDDAFTIWVSGMYPI